MDNNLLPKHLSQHYRLLETCPEYRDLHDYAVTLAELAHKLDNYPAGFSKVRLHLTAQEAGFLEDFARLYPAPESHADPDPKPSASFRIEVDAETILVFEQSTYEGCLCEFEMLYRAMLIRRPGGRTLVRKVEDLLAERFPEAAEKDRQSHLTNTIPS